VLALLYCGADQQRQQIGGVTDAVRSYTSSASQEEEDKKYGQQVRTTPHYHAVIQPLDDARVALVL
jgi:hypothetical protein